MITDFSFKGAKKRQQQKIGLILFITFTPLTLLILGKSKLAFLYFGLLLFIKSLLFLYFGVFQKDFNNKYLIYLGGWTRSSGIPKTKNIAVKYGLANFILLLLISVSLIYFAIIYN